MTWSIRNRAPGDKVATGNNYVIIDTAGRLQTMNNDNPGELQDHELARSELQVDASDSVKISIAVNTARK